MGKSIVRDIDNVASVESFVKLPARALLPSRYRTLLQQIYFCLTSPLFVGNRHKCPLCMGSFRKFRAYEDDMNAQCPRCGSFQRHRLLWLYLKCRTDFLETRTRVLDVAPIYVFQKICKNLKNLTYVSADLFSPIAMAKVDITSIHSPDNQFDCILCYHVLEHVSNDQAAMTELYRILKPGGWAILQSPVGEIDETIEHPQNISPDGHVRTYGRDYVKRLEKAGFTVKCDYFAKQLGENTVKRYGLIANEIIYLCKKART